MRGKPVTGSSAQVNQSTVRTESWALVAALLICLGLSTTFVMIEAENVRGAAVSGIITGLGFGIAFILTIFSERINR